MEISVVMPVYNGEQYLKEAIESILCQTYENFEFIIINDGSTDKTHEIIKSYDDKRINLFNIKNTGLANALNFGISKACHPIIARMDADDISLPKRFEKQVAFLKSNPDYILVGTGANEIDADGNFICQHNNLCTWEEIKKAFPRSPFVHPSVMYKKEAYLAAGKYPNFLSRGEDTVLFNRMSKIGKMSNIKENLLNYRISYTSLTDRDKKNQLFVDSLVAKTIDKIALTDEEIKLHAQIIKQKGTKNRHYLYHMYLTKKFLWNNPKKKSAYNHLLKALRIAPSRVEPYLYFFIGLLPSFVTQYLYKKIKNK